MTELARDHRPDATCDLDARDPDYIRETLPILWLFASVWHRAEVRGLDNIPDAGPVLLVGNHSGGLTTPDAPVFAVAFSTYYGVERPIYLLTHDVMLRIPGASVLRRWGMIPASRANTKLALRSGATVLVFPGGDYDACRPTSKSATIDFGGRKGFIDAALESGAPIVPVVSIGAQETQLFLSRGERIARLSPFSRRFRAIPSRSACRSGSVSPASRPTCPCRRRSPPRCSSRSTSAAGSVRDPIVTRSTTT